MNILKTTAQKLESIDQLEAWRNILNMPFLQIGEKFRNPFRIDNSPGCVLRVRGGNILMYDMASIQFRCMNCMQALQYVNIPINLDYTNHKKYEEKPFKFLINYIKKDYTKNDQAYWGQYGISLEQLEQESVDSVYQYSFNSKKHPDKIETLYPLGYTYCINVVERKKIYRPYSKHSRFLSDFSPLTIGGNTPITSPLIYTKSFKDYAVLTNFGYSSRFIHCENVLNPPKDGIYLVDNDAPGLKYRDYLNSNGYIAFTLPVGYPKDPSDCYRFLGEEKTKSLLNDCISANL